LHIFLPLIGHILKYGQLFKPIIEGCKSYLTLNIYGTKHSHFISHFEGEKKKFELGESIQKVINMHHLSLVKKLIKLKM
jgi:uncharacterized Fe-S cluster-containing protein